MLTSPLRAFAATAPMRFISCVVEGFVEHNDMTLAASIAYYTALSLAPLLILMLWLAASIAPSAQADLVNQLDALVGPDARIAVQVIIDSAARKPTSLGSAAGLFGIVLLVFSASAVFSQLQTALNVVWSTTSVVPNVNQNVFRVWLKRRILAIGLLAAFAFILIVSLAISALLALLLPFSGRLWDLLNQFAAIVVFTLLFAGLFRYLPDKRLSWRDTWGGAFVTAALFTLGKYAIGEYLAHSGIAGAYGPAGSLAVLLVWVYYSATIFLFGAECVRAVMALTRGVQG